MVTFGLTAAIVVSAINVVPTVSYVNLLYVDEQQLRNIALEALKAMLLQAGYPSNWGLTYNFDPDQVERFGLALAESSSLYVLDPDKVQRLVVGNPVGFMEYEDIRRKLNLQGYGFTLEILPPFKVLVNDKNSDSESNPLTLEDLVAGVKVLVTGNDGRPIPKASVKATLVYVLKGVQNVTYAVRASNSTDSLGKCVIKPEISRDGISDFVMVFKVAVADVTTITSLYRESIGHPRFVNASIIGENVTLTIPEGAGWEKDSSGARWVANMVYVSEDEMQNVYNGTLPDGTLSNDAKITWGKGHWGWSMLFPGLSYCNALFAIFSLSTPNPRRLALAVGPAASSQGFKVAGYGLPTEGSASVKVERCVIISGMIYIAELTLWKETP